MAKIKPFIDKWIAAHLDTVPFDPDSDFDESELFAAECLQAAEEKGFSPSDIEKAVGDLGTYIAKVRAKNTSDDDEDTDEDGTDL